MFYIKRLFALFSFSVIIFLSLVTFNTVKTDAVTTGQGLSAVKAYESMGGKVTSKEVFDLVAKKGGEEIAKKGIVGLGEKFIPIVGQALTVYDVASCLYDLYQLYLSLSKTPQPIMQSSGLGSISVPVVDSVDVSTVYKIKLKSWAGVPYDNPNDVVFQCTDFAGGSRTNVWVGIMAQAIHNAYSYAEIVEQHIDNNIRVSIIGISDSDGSRYTYTNIVSYVPLISVGKNLTFNVIDGYSSSNGTKAITTLDNPAYTYYSSISAPTVDISKNFGDGCQYAFPSNVDTETDYNDNTFNSYATVTPTVINNYNNVVDTTSGSVTPSSTIKSSGTGLGDIFDSIFKGIWGLLKGILDFFGGLIKLLTDMLLSLLVPRDGYFTDFFGSTRDLFNSKLSLNTNIDIFSPTYVNASGDGGLTNVSYPIFNTYTLTIPFDMLNPYLSKIREIMKGLIYPLIVFFNFNNIYKLIRGGSILNAAVDNIKGGQ